MENRDYNLTSIRRLLNFSLPLHQISLRPENQFAHNNSTAAGLMVTFVLDQEEKEMRWLEGDENHVFSHIPRMVITYPGTVKKMVSNSIRNEIMFVYKEEYADTFRKLGLTSCNFSFTDSFNEILKKIRTAITEIHRPGIADKLDILAVELAFEAALSARENTDKKNPPDERIFKIANHFRFHFREKIDLPKLLTRYNLSSRTFYREWNKFYTKSPKQYLLSLRLNYAMELLQDQSLCIYEVSERSGFCDPMYFQRCFTKHFGTPPGKYRKTVLKT